MPFLTPLRILVWSPQGFGGKYSGGGLAAWRLYSRLGDLGYTHTVHVHGAHGEPAQHLLSPFQSVDLISDLGNRSIPRKLLYLQKAKTWLKYSAHKFDIFHGIGAFDTTLLPALWAQQLGMQSFVKPSNYQADFVGGRMTRALQMHLRRRRIARTLAGMIAISAEIEAELLSFGVSPSRIHRIPNGVDADWFTQSSPHHKATQRQKLAVPLDAFHILFVGELGSRKQPHLILEAAARLPSTINVSITLAGPPHNNSYIDRLRELSNRYGLQTKLNIVGEIRDLRPFYTSADIFCLPSANEGMSNAVLEAMASGLPIVSYPTSGMRELVRHPKGGRIVDSVESLANALEYYSRRPEARASAGATNRNFVETELAVTEVLRRHLRIFNASIN